MKKRITVLAVILMTAAVLPVASFAEDAPPQEETVTEAPTEARPEDLYKFKINNAGRAEITDFIPSDTYQGELVIPDTLDGYEVGYIGNAAFMEAKGITSITIPAGVSDIGNSVFFGCTSLEKFAVKEGSSYLSILDGGILAADGGQLLVAYPAGRIADTYVIPGTVDEIAPGCFGFAQHLKEVGIPGSVRYIDSWAFAYSNLEKINTASVMQIDEYGFAYCNHLHDVTFNAGLEIISDASFSCCPALTQITLPDTLVSVGQFAFSGTGLTSVTIPRNVTDLNYGAFGYDADLKPISSFVIYGENGTEAEAYCTASDSENDYQNNFTFIAVNNAEEPVTPEEIPTRSDVSDTETDASASSEEQSENVSKDTTVILEQDTPSQGTAPNDPDLADVIAPEVKGSPFLQILLATVGGIALILAIVLLILMTKKNRKQDDKK